MGIESKELRGDVEAGIHRKDYHSRRHAISRRINEIADDPKACRNGLFALVGDGVHNYQPPKMAQLYTVHAVCDGGIEIPILHAVTAKKTVATYEKIFSHLRPHLQSHGIPERRLRIILDFEKAALRAAHKVFPDAKVEGCGFHLAQAWTRRRNFLGLTAFTQGLGKDPAVADWWNIIKGVPFLPVRLRGQVRALTTPPVPREHPAHKRCKEFLAYLHDTWLTGTYKNLWCKFGIYVLRTTNTAEAYHRKLKETFKCAHPPFATLIKALRRIDLQARCTLVHKDKNPNAEKRLRARDRRRRVKVERCMRRFNARYQTQGATNLDVERYCKKMARFVSNKAI
ncbi:hypothetical protein ANCCAN_18095 [Ancylostoma caninum]|uniref:MULE transposase domain-containing protein n=1 Tax=Ancylostoma caninum TaxID=29170 RepID=A0A368FX13_ANCCA|nr:hypothetical protein ANCCAN_18095 [Ancylostoma caninum]